MLTKVKTAISLRDSASTSGSVYQVASKDMEEWLARIARAEFEVDIPYQKYRFGVHVKHIHAFVLAEVCNVYKFSQFPSSLNRWTKC